MYPRESKVFHEILHAARHDDFRSPAGQPSRKPDDSPERRQIEMIHMRMGEQDEIDRRQILQQHAGMTLTAQQNQSLRKHRIDQHLAPIDLQEERGVPDKGHSQLVFGDQLDRMGSSHHRLFMALAHQPQELLHLLYCERPLSPHFTHLFHH